MLNADITTLSRVEHGLPETRILICDDHEIVRQGVREQLNEVEGWSVVGEAGDGVEAIGRAKQLKPDLIILDAAMPYARGIEVYAEVKRWLPDVKVAVLTGFTSPQLLASWVDAGVEGLFLKSTNAAELRQGLEAILAGARFISVEAAKILENATQRQPLTAREREVLSMITKGNTNPEIAERLHISVKTVEKHRGSLMAKLDVRSVSGLMIYAMREGLLDEFRQL